MSLSQGQGSSQGNSVPNELLRSVIREVLQDVVAAEVATTAPRGGVDRGETVVISTQADLDRTIARVLADASNPSRRRAIEMGRTRFVLESSAPTTRPTSTTTTASAGIERIMRGAVTERHVIAAARAGTVIVIGERVVITPLAKERARATGVEIRRER
ncbi:MAG: hypothetical protein ACKOW5_02960 [Actinomycetales bacterium]